MYRWIARNVFAQALDFSRGTRTMACLRNLETSQWWPRDRVLDLQNERLQRLMRHVYDTVPYYRRLFDERGLKPSDISCSLDLKKLPVLSKRNIRENLILLLASNFPKEKLIPFSTSGSTGVPLAFYKTKEDHQNWSYARELRSRSWSGYETGDKIVRFSINQKRGTGLTGFKNKLTRSSRRIMYFNPQTISIESLPTMVKHMEQFQPGFLAGYPSAIYLVTRYIQEKGNTNLKLKSILTGGEQLFDYQRELFYKVFKCETYSYYSTWEVGSIAGECTSHTGHHIAAENVIVEIADDSGNPVPPGVEGRILLTNLHNYAMPFIRYDIRDIGTISDVACPCGREGLPLLVNLNGRADATLLTKSGRRIPGRSISQFVFLANLGVEQYQIVQENYEEILIRLVLDNIYPEEHRARVIREIQNFFQPILGQDISVKVQFEQEISPAKSGKKEVFISKLSN